MSELASEIRQAPATKTCPACAEEIKAAALICPHCRIQQPRPPRTAEEQARIRGAGIVFLIIVVAVVVFVAWAGSHPPPLN